MTKIQTSWANQGNKHQKEVFYDIWDKVLLFTKNIIIYQLSKKLVYKMIYFFEFNGKKSISLELQHSQIMKIYNVFHLKLFQKATTDPLTGKVNKLALPIIINDDEE